MYTKITNGIKEAMIAKDTDKKDVLKQVKAKADAIAKETKTDMSNEIVIQAINKEIKQLNQTKDAIISKPDCDLFKSTVNKIEILTAFLPKQLSKSEIVKAIEDIKVANSTIDNKGALLGIVMKTLKGKADNRLIKETFDELNK